MKKFLLFELILSIWLRTLFANEIRWSISLFFLQLKFKQFGIFF